MPTLRIRIFVTVLALALAATHAFADPAPTPAATPAALMSAEVAVGDWRLHPVDDDAPRLLGSTALLALDVHGLHAHRSRLQLAAGIAALVGGLLIAGSRSGNACSGPACDLGTAALLVAAPLLDAASRDERSP